MDALWPVVEAAIAVVIRKRMLNGMFLNNFQVPACIGMNARLLTGFFFFFPLFVPQTVSAT